MNEEKNTLTIITQNLDGYLLRKKEGLSWSELEEIKKRYKEKYKADIYAFQESYKDENSVGFSAETVVANKSFQKDMCVSGRAEEIWDKVFSWSKTFRDGYWYECDIIFTEEKNQKIRIINVHCPTRRHYYQIRYTLLKRLSEIPKDRLTILLGDFNAAFNNQTENPIDENDKFLREITETYGFIECVATDECDQNNYNDDKRQYYTVCYEKISRKLDHIFISKSLLKLLNGSYTIEYIDEVNRNPPPRDKRKAFVERRGIEPFTDHSGIMLTITLPDS